MNNLQRMKDDLCAQIQAQDAEQFYNLVAQLEELSAYEDFEKEFGINLSPFYTCEKCHDDHDKCAVGGLSEIEIRRGRNVCREKFVEFAEKDV